MLINPFIFSSTAPPVSCAYPLDADQAEIDGILPGREKMLPSNSDQTGTWILTSSSADFQQSALVRSFIPSGRPDLVIEDGKRIVEIEFDPPTLAAEDTVVLNQFIGLSGSPKSVGVIRYRGGDGLYELTVNGTVTAGLSSAPTLFAFGFDFTAPGQTEGTCHMTVWGDGEIVYTNASYDVSPAYTPIMLCTQRGAPLSGAVGQAATTSIRTNSANMVGSYPGGWTDVCGNPL